MQWQLPLASTEPLVGSGVLALMLVPALPVVVVSRSLTVPPAAPATGSCYIVPAGSAAAWGQPAGSLMHWQGTAWLAQMPRDGQIAIVADEAIMLVHLGGSRSNFPVAGLTIGGRAVLAASPVAVALPSGGASIDSEARSVLAAVVLALQQQGILA